MTTGIYKLIFSEDVFYVGKSINMENRYNQHVKNLQNNKASEKMQAAYKMYGLPKVDYIFECHPDHLDIIETYLIWYLQPPLNTVLSEAIDEESWNILDRNSYLLKDSTVDHLLKIEQLLVDKETLEWDVGTREEKIEELEKALAHQRTQEEVTNEAAQELKTLRIEAGEAIERREKEIELLQKKLSELETPWYKKLFG